MRKSVKKILCAATVAASVLTATAFSACGTGFKGVSMDSSYSQVTSNGGFLVETGDYVYFINGVEKSDATNKYGEVLKGSIQRIKKSDFNARKYSASETVVPSVIYSGSNDAGIYIYDGYIYYTTPTSDTDYDGNTLNSNLDFKRTRLDGTDTSAKPLFRCANNSVNYRFVNVGGTVYILYSVSENLYGETKQNVHSVNCTTGKDTLIAYGVTATNGFAFDSEDLENPYVYYTMSVFSNLSSGATESYNQLYRARADVTEGKSYDFSEIEDYDASKNPVYVNLGEPVFDGIGYSSYEFHGLTQFNYGYGEKTYEYDDLGFGYTYSIKWYKNGVLYYTRNNLKSEISAVYTISDGDINGENGKVKADWDAIKSNNDQTAFLYDELEDSAVLVTLPDKDDNDTSKLYAISGASMTVRQEVKADGTLGEKIVLGKDSGITPLTVRQEGGHTNLYYTVNDSVKRLAIDGAAMDYERLPVDEDIELEYSAISILNLYVNKGWYKPEFVGNTLVFASEIGNMSSYDYVVACDLSGADGIMTNAEIKAYNEQFKKVQEDIDELCKKVYASDSDMYDKLTNSCKYLYYTRDNAYLEELIKAYADIEGETEVYTDKVVETCKDYFASQGVWEEYKDTVKNVNGEDITPLFSDYYYSLLGKMTDKDAEALRDVYRGEYMENYPEDTSTWWQKMSTGAKVGTVIGICVGGLAVIAGITVLTIWLIKRKRKGILGETDEKAARVDITDDKNVDVYGEGEQE